MGVIQFTPSRTIERFLRSSAFVRGLIGPFGSGKSVGCCVEIMRRISEQQPQADGKRRSRWVVVRNSYRELQDTTIQTFHDWFPEELGEWRKADMMQTINVGDIEAEILFRSLDKPQDIRKLLSLEITGAWINEAREIPYAIVKAVIGRLGRYPARRDGGPTWTGLIMDTNPPDTDHWWYRKFEEERPDDWEIFHQPSGLSMDAENVENLPERYYERMMAGADPAWIDVYVHGKYGFVQDGKPIYPEYNDHIHTLEEEPPILKPMPGRPGQILVGVDYGLTPAAVIGQQAADGQLIIHDELVTEDMGAVRFGELLAAKLRQEWPGYELSGWDDPAGEQRVQTDEATPNRIMRDKGVPLTPAYTNDFTIRREAVAGMLTRLTMSGQPSLVISPKCRVLRKAMAGQYRYRRLQVTGQDKYADKPDKNEFSHVAEALQYLCVGIGEGRTVLASSAPTSIRARRTIRPRIHRYGQ